MNNKILYIALFLVLMGLAVNADSFVPDFNSMKKIKCEIEEFVYAQNGTQITQNSYFRIFNLDDENKKIYLQKAPVDKIIDYTDEKITLKQQTLTDDFIISESIELDRINGGYHAVADITYDSEFFPPRKSKSVGYCKVIN